tara:strand:- start:791 stop:982 length:192 start_codon:yes stop_codon:yes gene_type:complete
MEKYILDKKWCFCNDRFLKAGTSITISKELAKRLKEEGFICCEKKEIKKSKSKKEENKGITIN